LYKITASAASITTSAALMAERLTRVPRVREVESSLPKGTALATVRHRSKPPTSMQVALLPWRYEAKMGAANANANANSLHAWRNTASIIQCLFISEKKLSIVKNIIKV